VAETGRASAASATKRATLGITRTVDVISGSPVMQNEPTYGPVTTPVRRFGIHVAIWFPKEADSLRTER
jgi:hypothetical protein